MSSAAFSAPPAPSGAALGRLPRHLESLSDDCRAIYVNIAPLSVHRQTPAEDSVSVTDIRDQTTAMLEFQGRERHVHVQLQVLPAEGPGDQHVHRPVYVRSVL